MTIIPQTKQELETELMWQGVPVEKWDAAYHAYAVDDMARLDKIIPDTDPADFEGPGEDLLDGVDMDLFLPPFDPFAC